MPTTPDPRDPAGVEADGHPDYRDELTADDLAEAGG